MDLTTLTFLKDAGIGLAALLILGRIMFSLVQAAVEFFHGLREDNKERNGHFAMLLATNQAIAGQMELTRQAIERSAKRAEAQSEAIQANTTEVAGVRQAVGRLTQELEPLGAALDRDLKGPGEDFGAQLTQATHQVIDSLSQKVDDAQENVAGALQTAMQPVLTKLDTMRRELGETRQAILDGFGQVVRENANAVQSALDRHLEDTGPGE